MNEEPHPQVFVGEFTDEEEWQVLCLLSSLVVDEFDAKKDIPRDQTTGPLLTFTWVRTVTVKNGAPNNRLCLRPFGRQSDTSKGSLYCPTPGPQTYNMLLVLAAHHGWSVRSFRREPGRSCTHPSKLVCFLFHQKSIRVRFLVVSGK